MFMYMCMLHLWYACHFSIAELHMHIFFLLLFTLLLSPLSSQMPGSGFSRIQVESSDILMKELLSRILKRRRIFRTGKFQASLQCISLVGFFLVNPC